MAIKNEMKLEFPSRPENVGLARVTVAAFATQLDYTLADLEEIKVAVSEAVTNAIVHGYGGGPEGMVTIRAYLHDDALEVLVEDRGRGIDDVSRALEPGYSTDPERPGLGFVFMQSFMDRLEVDSAPGRGTRIGMYKLLSRPEQ